MDDHELGEPGILVAARGHAVVPGQVSTRGEDRDVVGRQGFGFEPLADRLLRAGDGAKVQAQVVDEEDEGSRTRGHGLLFLRRPGQGQRPYDGETTRHLGQSYTL